MQAEIIALRHQLTVLQTRQTEATASGTTRPLLMGLAFTFVVELAFSPHHRQA
jgi:hypothetical protein